MKIFRIAQPVSIMYHNTDQKLWSFIQKDGLKINSAWGKITGSQYDMERIYNHEESD